MHDLRAFDEQNVPALRIYAKTIDLGKGWPDFTKLGPLFFLLSVVRFEAAWEYVPIKLLAGTEGFPFPARPTRRLILRVSFSGSTPLEERGCCWWWSYPPLLVVPERSRPYFIPCLVRPPKKQDMLINKNKTKQNKTGQDTSHRNCCWWPFRH